MRICDLIVEAKIPAKCEKCGHEFEFTLKDDVYLWTGDWSIRTKCPKCGAIHKIEFEMNLAEVDNDTTR